MTSPTQQRLQPVLTTGSHELLSECIIWDFAEEAWSKLLRMDGNPDQWSQR